jgi:transcriptional regulator with XRE-family HTH domain
MKINVDILLKLRKDKSWTQDEVAIASGLNIRTVQRIENEASASIQSIKALASAFDINVYDLKYKETSMLAELKGKKVSISSTGSSEFSVASKGVILEHNDSWLKLQTKKNIEFIRIEAIFRIELIN